MCHGTCLTREWSMITAHRRQWSGSPPEVSRRCAGGAPGYHRRWAVGGGRWVVDILTAGGGPAVGRWWAGGDILDIRPTAGCRGHRKLLAVVEEVEESLVASVSFTSDHRRSPPIFGQNGNHRRTTGGDHLPYAGVPPPRNRLTTDSPPRQPRQFLPISSEVGRPTSELRSV